MRQHLHPVTRLAVALAAALAVALGASREADAQQIKARVLVLVDTSGSMVWHFNNNLTAGGDGDLASRFTDINQAGKNYYPGKIVNGMFDGVNSRLYAAKAAVTNVVNATGDIDFGLMRYAAAPVGKNSCNNSQNCCDFTTPECVVNSDYVDNGGKLTWSGDCGPRVNGVATDGGQLLVAPAAGSSKLIGRWVDGIEDFRDDGNGAPLNGELRANGSTPLAGSARTALNAWYLPILNFTRANPNCDPGQSVLCDPQIDCRPYVFVQMTDGADTCDTDTINGPPNAVKALHAANPNNPVLTYVIGLAFINGDPAINVLNNMATQGGTNAARFANDQAAIEAAFGDIIASSVRVEYCNGKDDNCNGQVDEGYDLGAKCQVGIGACLRKGVKKCDPMNNTQTACCVDDGKAACAPLVAGMPGPPICNNMSDNNCNGVVDSQEINCPIDTPQPEICDGKDNDLDGVIDNNLIDVGRGCGLNVGQCKMGTTVCQNSMGQDVTKMGVVGDKGDRLVCTGGVGPVMETCNGLDDDCDGIVDGMTRTCYDGPNGTRDVGICLGGLQRCTATPGSGMEAWGACVGQIDPSQELCNGKDDDCNGIIDDVKGFGAPCCPSGLCGKGICQPGAMQCSGGQLVCTGGQGPAGEVCNGIDDDCNGQIDDLPNIGHACLAQNGCPGSFACDVQNRVEVCSPAQMNCMPNDCGGDARVGMPCGPGVGLPAPCMAGVFACVDGMVVCQGGVGPSAEVCNCRDDDCNGQVDDGANGNCPDGTACFMCSCAKPCDRSEFPCPADYDCINPPKGCMSIADCPGVKQDCIAGNCGPGYCVPSGLCNPPCMPGKVCRGAACVDVCETLNCPKGFKCVTDHCEDQSCRATHNCKSCENGAGGEICDLAKDVPECVPDPCCGVDCGAGNVCDPSNGKCIVPCAGVACPAGSCCTGGQCKECDPCANVKCPEGQSCDAHTGQCYLDHCQKVVCNATGFVCCGDGSCKADACLLINCPAGTRCTTNPADCTHLCDLPPGPGPNDVLVVGAGGGGLSLGCSVGAGRGAARSSENPLAFAIAALLSLALRPRRRAPASRPADARPAA